MSTTTEVGSEGAPLAYTVPKAAKMLCVGQSTIWKLLREQRI